MRELSDVTGQCLLTQTTPKSFRVASLVIFVSSPRSLRPLRLCGFSDPFFPGRSTLKGCPVFWGNYIDNITTFSDAAPSEVETVVPKRGVWQTYDVTDGLAGQVTCMRQDGRGYLWMGTYTGLCRYDGAEFTTYITDDGYNTPLLPFLPLTDSPPKPR